MAARTRTPEWWGDPTKRHRLRYRAADGWTDWVADDERVGRDAKGREIAVARDRRRRRRAWVISIVAIVLGGLVLVSWIAMFQSAGDRLDLLRAEADSWELPATVVRNRVGDLDVPANFGANNASVTRSFRPAPGVTLPQAAHDLVAALNSQGYVLTHDFRGSWSGSCIASGCDVTVSSWPSEQVIDVELDSRT